MGTATLVAALIAINASGATIHTKAAEKQNDVFRRYWGTEFVWKLDALPDEGTIPKGRVPYSGYIYPDRAGGTISVLRKYDRAFNRGNPRATAYEQWDTTAFKEPAGRGLLGLLGGMRTPDWHGHCNGWAAAAIRHAEPQTSVRRNGTVFSPADIKALLAEIYIYNDIEHLAGLDFAMNAGLFHAIVTNWLGRGSHGLGMESDPGKEKWNYPVYAYASSSAERAGRQVEVKMNLAYIKDTNSEYNEAPRNGKFKYFHYVLQLNTRGEITGGTFYRDSSIIDMLWIPLAPKQGGQKGNEPGNPHVNVNQVLALWRDSVPQSVRSQWLVIDPPKEDCVSSVSQATGLVPLQGGRVVTVETPVAIVTDQPDRGSLHIGDDRDESQDASGGAIVTDSAPDRAEAAAEGTSADRRAIETEEVTIEDTSAGGPARGTAETVFEDLLENRHVEETEERVVEDAVADQPAAVSEEAVADLEPSPDLTEISGRLRRCLAEYFQNREDVARRSPRSIMHASAVYGIDTEIRADGRNINAIGWLCWNGTCRGQRLLGLRDEKIYPRVGPGLQEQPGQLLAMLAQSRVPASYGMKVDGREFTVNDLIEHEKLTCLTDTVLSYRLLGLVHYLDIDATWVNENGEQWDVSRLIEEELEQASRGARDGSTRRLMGLSYAVRNREKRGGSIDGEWARARKYVEDYREFAFELQDSEGGFSSRLLEPPTVGDTQNRRLEHTGRTLEWLLFALPNERLRDPQVVRSVDYLTRLLLSQESHAWEVGPKGHALHALAIYEERVFGSKPGSRTYLATSE